MRVDALMSLHARDDRRPLAVVIANAGLALCDLLKENSWLSEYLLRYAASPTRQVNLGLLPGLSCKP